jgi:tetratricopeptide (TPR) repeat protein
MIEILTISSLLIISPTITLPPPPDAKTIPNEYFVSQSFNNCGPAALSMALSYFGIHKSQEELGQELRPYQTPQGDNDDKSVTLDELEKKAQEYNLVTYHRPNGTIQMLKNFIAQDIPVITLTWMSLFEDIGHYRIIKGYDNKTRTFIQDDSYQGKDLKLSYSDLTNIWSKHNSEYLLIVPKNKTKIAEAIIGEDLNETIAWQKTANNNLKKLETNPDDIYTRFNLSVAYYHLKKFDKSIQEFEKIETNLPAQTLWYQIEPIKSYYELGNYDKVFALTDNILNNGNRAFSELYILRGEIYLKQEEKNLARQEFEKAIKYNPNIYVFQYPAKKSDLTFPLLTPALRSTLL